MKIRDKVYNKLVELNKDSKKKGITANEIAVLLEIPRNVVSHYLNELCRDGKAMKTNTRPVYFYDTLSIEVESSNDVDCKEESNKDPFLKLIGSNGSLKEQVEQCKAAAVYPNKGLPITLTGNSGVGKSFIASIIYEYAIHKDCIKSDAPFITFNCADYANNPELLSANLFGYKKGAFTGADKDTEGLIESADGGYLFLDEVHRLSPEGQEKLFLFLDQGKFRRIGETSKWRRANVRFIFATTENLDEVLLDTFKRRIPIFVDIPSLDERTLSERLSMIYNFYHNEAKEINKDLVVSKNVVNSLLSINGNGNIGLLKNIIISSCANAYRSNNKGKEIEIDLRDLPGKFKNSTNIKKNFYHENMKIYKDNNIENKILNSEYEDNETIKKELKNILKSLNNLNKGTIDEEIFTKQSNRFINKILKEMIFNNSHVEKDILTYELIFNVVENALMFIQKNYGIKYYGNTTKVLTYVIILLGSNENEDIKTQNEYKGYINILKKRLSKSYLLGKKLSEIIENTLDRKLGGILFIFLTLYFNGFISQNKSKCNGIIVAHGFSTASSIAAVANTCFEEFIFEPFDMPIDVPTSTVVSRIKEYLTNINTENGTIILVDMGSLNEIYEELKSNVNGNVGIINNISTRLALDVASKIINKENIEDIVESCSKNNSTEYRFYEAKDKKKAIVVTCISGVGTAEKIREIILKCIGQADIEILAQDYNSISEGIKNNNTLKDYDVRLVISTTTIDVPEVRAISLQNLINGESDDILEEVLKDVNKKKSIDDIKDDMIKFLSLQNILNQLTILNPNKIVDEVSKVVNNYQLALNMNFESDLKLALFIHISMLIERLVLRDEITDHPYEESFIKNNKDFILETNNIFKDILKEYKVSLSLAEIINIYDIIHMRKRG
ncbi:sigma 54-interacting transcriptional regulator [Clostridium sardiniense]|uniref:sigma 54-interacting transcriptional regulator n=1 Tax=Clostridium sardiniense TaxID=29369 RepID=UPI0019590CC7|nr:sigma 54-interacting transcriptional regulator [Clostridium sardiniense]MBM7835490.1 sigma-54 dependent transcriptional regulator of gfr operon [Clostridium sardiniense]